MSGYPGAYQVDAHWKIIAATDAFCQMVGCPESNLIGSDARDLLREDWRHDFRIYVARALAGAGDIELTVPLVSPGRPETWFKHQVEPVITDGALAGYRASIQPYQLARAEVTRRWWEWRPATAPRVWDFDIEPITR